MKMNLRTLSPALISACLALPLLAEHEISDASTGVHANIPSRVLSGEGATNQMLGVVSRASDVIGLEVQNLQNEKLGKVSDLAVDLASGRIVEVVVSSGGVLGLGSSLIGVPPGAFHYDSQAKVLHLDRTKDSLKGLPAFEVSQWEENFQSPRVAEVYRAYGQTPYFGTNPQETPVGRNGAADAAARDRLNPDAGNPDRNAIQADNTGRNRRDRDGTTVTPGDQGNSASDIAITSRIRKAVLAREGLSVNARNVKIITINGHVTLRGPVNSEEEKRAVADIAGAVVLASDVDNRIEVAREGARN